MYSYNPLQDNASGQSLQELGTSSGFISDYSFRREYSDYYGSTEYATQWIEAAFSGTTTGLTNGDDFGKLGMEGRAGTCQ